MISNEISKMLNAQVNAELWSAYLYLSMSLDAELHGYRGVSNWFNVQSREELDHARLLVKYMMAHGSKVRLLPMPEVQQEWDSPHKMFCDALLHEQSITHSIHDIMHHAQQERDYATCSMLSWFVDEQVEEEEACTDLVQQFAKASDAPCFFMQIDLDLQQRQYEPAMNKPHKKWYS